MLEDFFDSIYTLRGKLMDHDMELVRDTSEYVFIYEIVEE